jgi:pimeloyl-[acyl-carrier protein] synthase
VARDSVGCFSSHRFWLVCFYLGGIVITVVWTKRETSILASVPELFSDEFYLNPYLTYANLRQHKSLAFHEKMGWLALRNSDVKAFVRDERLCRAGINKARMAVLSDPVKQAAARFFDGFQSNMLNSDPPAHTRFRAQAATAFSRASVENLRGRIERIAVDLLEQLPNPAEFDVIADFAFPLPSIVIMEILGVPPNDRHLLKKWSSDFVTFTNAIQAAPPNLEMLARNASDSTVQMRSYIAELIKERRRQPRQDFISELIQIQQAEDGRLNGEEVLVNCNFILSAGHETTTNLIGNGLSALLQFPEQMDLLRSQPGILTTAIEEFLRYDSPIQASSRVAAVDFEFNGRSISKGERIWLVFASSNRDPDAFVEPDRLDITRRPNNHHAFGFDRHICLGARLARLEGEVAMGILLQKFKKINRVDGDAKWHRSLSFRGLEALAVNTELN